MEQPPVFIGGINRTGTSLARRLLGSHSLLAMPPTELEFFKRADAPFSRDLEPARALELASKVLSWPKVAAWGLDPDEVLTRVAAGGHNARGVFVAILGSFAAAAGKPRFGEKTTAYEQHLGILDRWFGDDYVFVHMVRHPVNAYASARWYDGVEREIDVRRWAVDWRTSVMTAMTMAGRRSHRYVIVRYEDLVRDTEAELARICAVAGLAYDDRMLMMTDFAESENSSFGGEGARYRGKVREVDDVLRAERIPFATLSELRKGCRTVARRAGYDVDDAAALSPFPQQLTVRRLAVTSGSAWRLAGRVRSRLG